MTTAGLRFGGRRCLFHSYGDLAMLPGTATIWPGSTVTKAEFDLLTVGFVADREKTVQSYRFIWKKNGAGVVSQDGSFFGKPTSTQAPGTSGAWSVEIIFTYQDASQDIEQIDFNVVIV